MGLNTEIYWPRALTPRVIKKPIWLHSKNTHAGLFLRRPLSTGAVEILRHMGLGDTEDLLTEINDTGIIKVQRDALWRS
ncbi:MAG TPA: hypothetical protein DCE52_17325 [Rhodobacteraceae bacterium]|jgi:hypothetical protein|nr:hypothetical protein [Paracoccaceae bacterium]